MIRDPFRQSKNGLTFHLVLDDRMAKNRMRMLVSNFGGFSDIDSAGLIIDLLDGPKRITSTTKTQGITLSDFAVLGGKR